MGGYVGWGRGRLYTYRYTVTTRLTSALRWAAIRAILYVSLIVNDKVTRPTTFLKGKESRGGIEHEALLLTSLTPYRWAKPAHRPADEKASSALRASLSGTFLQTLPEFFTPLKGHSLSPRSCPATLSAPSERFGY